MMVCVAPLKDRSIACASARVLGLPRILFLCTMSVSAPITIAFLCLLATARAFPRASFLARTAGGSFKFMFSLYPLFSIEKEIPASAKILRRQGDAEANIIFLIFVCARTRHSLQLLLSLFNLTASLLRRHL